MCSLSTFKYNKSLFKYCTSLSSASTKHNQNSSIFAKVLIIPPEIIVGFKPADTS